MSLRTNQLGQQVCEPCWNSQHYTAKTDKRTGRRIGKTSNCEGDPCECYCRELLKEQTERRGGVKVEVEKR